MNSTAEKPPYRAYIAAMIFCATALNYVYRTHFQISVLAMSHLKRGGTEPSIPAEGTNETVEEVELPNYGPRYNWTSTEEGLLLASYFYGYTVSSIPGGIMAEYFGPLKMIFYSFFLKAIISCISPFAVADNIAGLFICRFILGVLAGVHYPALQSLIGKWAPREEKGVFISMLMGSVLGTVITFPLTAYIIDGMGWSWSFHFPAIYTLLFCAVWYVIVTDSPDECRFVSQEELTLIQESHGTTVTKNKGVPPYWSMIKSIPFIALVIGQFGSLWGLYLMITGSPKFLSEVYKFDLKGSGGIAALPNLARFIFSFIFGGFSDYIQKKGYVTANFARKGFVLFSHLLPGLILYSFFVGGMSDVCAITILCIMMGMNAAAAVTNLQNPHDLAPNFAGTQYGIMNFFGSIPGFMSPLIVGEITKEKSELSEWAIIFAIGGTIYIVTGIVFIIFGSTKVQPWNDIKSNTEPELPVL